jgi:O-antigen/teichoic acid export membrane protein
MQDKRGDDPDFLNTAWTLQIMRGGALWLIACALAFPAAWIYDEPMLAQLLPVVGFGAVLNGLNTTKVATANRHIRLGRMTMLALMCQAIGICVMAALAWWMQSVWALVIGNLITAAFQRSMFHRYLPGVNNRLHWDAEAFKDIFGFGKFIFLSTMAGFIISQGDRMILAGYVSMADLGIYGVGFFLGTLPLTLARVASTKIIMPLYRLKPPAESKANRKKIFYARRSSIIALFLASFVLAFSSVPLIEFLYDDRYSAAGPVVTLFSLAILPQLVGSGYGGALLANGDSKRHFYLLTTTAVLQLIFMYLLITRFGMFGAIISPALAALCAFPLRSYFVSRYKANDSLADVFFLCLGGAVNGTACWLYWDEIQLIIS